ncbi:MAG: hypothetical protein ACRENB_12985, partial [Gemmatimonadales bacterium]
MTGRVLAKTLSRALASSGSAVAALSANFAAGCVGLFAPLGVAITALGLDWLHLWDVQRPILYGASAVSVASLAHAAWRHRRPALLALGVASVAALLYPLHQAMNVTLFRWSLNAGAAGLVLATAWSVVLSRRAAGLAPGAADGRVQRDRQG